MRLLRALDSLLPNSVSQFIRYRKYRRKGITIAPFVEIIDSEFEDEVRCATHASIRHSRIGFLTAIGRYTKLNHAIIGRFCAISWDTTVGATSHPRDHLTTSAFPYVPYVGNFVHERTQEYVKTRVGHDVWIGCNAVVLPGVRIGDGVIVGAGSVVTSDLPDYAIAVGTPARVVKLRFSEPVIERLRALRWWDWPRERIQRNISLFQRSVTPALLDELEADYD